MADILNDGDRIVANRAEGVGKRGRTKSAVVFQRVLKPDGVFLHVVPGARHLWELKQVLYEKPYLNDEHSSVCEGFRYLDIVPVDEAVLLPDPSVIHDLFEMTPYFWKTPQAGRERLSALDRLTVTVSFRIHIFRRNE